jgi:hypothetical protein
MWSSRVGAGPVEWPMDPGLTASAEGSPRPADGVRSGHEGREAYQHRVVWTLRGYQCRCARKSRRRIAHVLESPRSEIRARGKESFAEEKFSPRLSSRDVRSLKKDLHGEWQDCCGEEWAWRKRLSLGIMEVGGRRIGIKASRPLDVDTSLLSSLSDCLKDSCVLVTSFLSFFYSIFSSIFSLDLLPSLARQRKLSLAPVV